MKHLGVLTQAVPIFSCIGQIKSESILDEAALHDIWTLLEEFSKSEDDVLKINYDGFSQASSRVMQSPAAGAAVGVAAGQATMCACMVFGEVGH